MNQETIKEITEKIKKEDAKYFALFTEEKQIIQELGKLTYYLNTLTQKLWHVNEENSQKEPKETLNENQAPRFSPLAEESDSKTKIHAMPKPDKPKRQRKRKN